MNIDRMNYQDDELRQVEDFHHLEFQYEEYELDHQMDYQ
jgi:hypothetical protein